MRQSLGTRLLLMASVVMAVFFGITGVVIERANHDSLERALQQRLQSFGTMLIAASEPGMDGGARIAHPVPETRFFLPRSGLYARILRNDGRHLWYSPSVDTLELDLPLGLERGARRFDDLTLANGSVLRVFSIGVAWQGDSPLAEVFTISVAEDLAAFNAQLSAFRRLLWGWLLVVAITLLIVQWTVLRWGLAPLRRVAVDIAAIESGEKARLDGDYPVELRTLTDNLNTLVVNEREQRERSRRALADLAHSLKTPLAILRGGIEGRDEQAFRATAEHEIGRMSEIIDYQLRRAATAGRSALRATVPAERPLRKVVDALDKAWRDKGVVCELDVAADLRFHGDEEDLVELLGNLLDNAYKWCRGHVRVSIAAAPSRVDGMDITIDDDGPGIADEVAVDVFERGVRADESREGHGIGLAIVRDIVAVYEGVVRIGRSELGGASVKVSL